MTSRFKWGRTLIGLIVLYLAFSGNRGLWNLYKLHQERKELERGIAVLNSDIHRCQLEYKMFEKNALALEKQAREELSLVKTGETIYRFSRSDSY